MKTKFNLNATPHFRRPQFRFTFWASLVLLLLTIAARPPTRQTFAQAQDPGLLPSPIAKLNYQSPPLPGGCVESLSPAEYEAAPAGETFSVVVNAPRECQWGVQSNADWLTSDVKSSGTGSGKINITVAPNRGPTSRLSTLDIGGKTLTVTQNSTRNQPRLRSSR